MADASLFFEVDCLVAGGAELQDDGGIAQARGHASKVHKCNNVSVKRSRIAEGPCGYRQSFWISLVLFFV